MTFTSTAVNTVIVAAPIADAGCQAAILLAVLAAASG